MLNFACRGSIDEVEGAADGGEVGCVKKECESAGLRMSRRSRQDDCASANHAEHATGTLFVLLLHFAHGDSFSEVVHQRAQAEYYGVWMKLIQTMGDASCELA